MAESAEKKTWVYTGAYNPDLHDRLWFYHTCPDCKKRARVYRWTPSQDLEWYDIVCMHCEKHWWNGKSLGLRLCELKGELCPEPRAIKEKEGGLIHRK